MNHFKYWGILIAVGLFAAVTLVGKEDEEATSPDEQVVAFCKPVVPALLKQANATFYEIYKFKTDSNGAPIQIEHVQNQQGVPSAESCIASWRLGLKDYDPVVVTLRWKHGVGWTEMTIRASDFHQRIVDTVPTGYP